MDQKKPQEEVKPRRARKKKVRGHGGHHGGAWKVAYADFVTAMMALFLVLWLVSQADTKLKEQIANYFRSPGAFTSSRGGIMPGKAKISREPSKLSATDEEQTLYGIAQQLQKKFDTQPEFGNAKNKVVVEVVEEGLQIEIVDKADDVSFEVGSAQLNESARRILEEIAAAICELPNPIKIGGHTDRRVFPSSNGYTNWELSTDRANAARRIMVRACVDPKQILRIIGFADTDPIIERDAYHPANRRISITVMRQTRAEEEPGPISTGETRSDAPDKDALKNQSEEKVDKGERLKKMREKIERDNADKESGSGKETESSGAKPRTKTEIANAKLKREGRLSVGTPDRVPDAPTRKERPVVKP